MKKPGSRRRAGTPAAGESPVEGDVHDASIAAMSDLSYTVSGTAPAAGSLDRSQAEEPAARAVPLTNLGPVVSVSSSVSVKE